MCPGSEAITITLQFLHFSVIKYRAQQNPFFHCENMFCLKLVEFRLHFVINTDEQTRGIVANV